MSTPQQPGQSQSPVPVGTPAGGASSYGMMSPPQQQQPQVAAGQSMAVAGVDSTGQQRRAHLYVGCLSPRVTEHMLTEIFAVAGPVAQAKIIQDRNFQHGGLNYGFVEYSDTRAAEQALQTLNGRKIFDTEIRVNWAYQTQSQTAALGATAGAGPNAGVAGVMAPMIGGTGQPGMLTNKGKEDTHNHFHVFVGDLSPEVNDEALTKAFGAFPTMSEARVMWDMNSGKSRGYGFLAFREKSDAEQAISTMNGEWLGSRAIRVNWANQKTQTGGSRVGGMAGGMGMGMGMGMASSGGFTGAPAPSNFSGGPLDFETVVSQTPAYNTTVYVGNLIPYSTQADLIPLFQGYGYIVEIRMQADRGFAFVKLDTHEHAAQAIVNLQNYPVHGRPIKCSWGKDREGGAAGGTAGRDGHDGRLPSDDVRDAT
ncbi:hypothetical protein FFLO_05422 [Filobasidium floriforme]|uniref:RRM domain-containing protein n=1 Tax=Filobasidium floriforme TaxID=5210 RepID=A0A8K0JI93_9TREE|nr:uncharacterized protein HD553DRAFT_135042 [Filobasidium floriforme]KAG7529782.1 hypothetical protein FFLO_05422 [Filobasidium floriforme]KAH8079330.1 hypothetical protein HD553DRAFT_135042 [Filobasidium floriforme]